MEKLIGLKILMFVDEIYEDLELWYPKLRLAEEGAIVTVAGPEANKKYFGKNGYPCTSDVTYNDVEDRSFDGLVIPGGFAPDKLRRDKKVLELTRNIFSDNKLVAHICHGGWIPISAGIVKGFKCTSTPGIKDDLINAGAEWVDQSVVTDRNMISSRRPEDLPDFCREIINYLQKQQLTSNNS
jgi:protease I